MSVRFSLGQPRCDLLAEFLLFWLSRFQQAGECWNRFRGVRAFAAPRFHPEVQVIGRVDWVKDVNCDFILVLSSFQVVLATWVAMETFWKDSNLSPLLMSRIKKTFDMEWSKCRVPPQSRAQVRPSVPLVLLSSYLLAPWWWSIPEAEAAC